MADGKGGDQFDWEPPRLVLAKRTAGRPARLRALGNAVCPAQGYAAIQIGRAALDGRGFGQLELDYKRCEK